LTVARSRLHDLLTDRLDFLRTEKEAVPGLAQLAKIATRIIIEYDRYVNQIFVILLQSLNRCHAPLQRDIEDICAPLRPEANAISAPKRDSGNLDTLYRTASFE
jgi:hypothetical protein